MRASSLLLAGFLPTAGFLLTAPAIVRGSDSRPRATPAPRVAVSAAPLRKNTMTGITASTSQRVHPVLIRNEHNPFLHIVVNAPDDGAQVLAFRISLNGTGAVQGLDALELFAAAEGGEFSPAAPFGLPAAGERKVEFRGTRPLRRGENVFWLSCRLKATAGLGGRVAAVCTAVETSAGTVEPLNRTPGVRHRVGVALRKHRDDGVHTYRIPTLATTAKGTLLCAYDMRRRMGRDLQEDIDIGLSRSTDGGRTWEAPRVIMDMGEYGGLPQEQNGCSDPGMVVDRKTGEIFCFAVWMWGKPGKHQWNGDGSEPGFEIGKSAQLLMVRSQDDGRTWSKPVNLTRVLKKEEWWLLAPAPNQGIQLPDGVLVMPMQGRDAQGVPFATIMHSRDHGATWTVGNSAYRQGNECQAVQLGDGSIMLNMRNDNPDRFRAVYITRDLGQTWEPHPTNRSALIEPNCNGSLYRMDYREGDEARHVLLFANPHTQEGRTHQTIQVSDDDGRSWPEHRHLLLDEGRGAGYPSLSRVDSRHVGIVYEGSQSHLVFERFTLDELLRR